jgi:hypothetical protein
MATSGDTTFDLTADEICTDALVNVGAIGAGNNASGKMLVHARRVLNRVVKACDADGKFLWRGVRREITLTDGTASYAIGADVLEVEDPMNFRRSAVTARSPVRFMSNDDFMAITDRTIEGIPSLFTVEYALPTTITILLYPTPDTTGDVVEYRAMLRGQDYDTGAQTGDFPSRWANTLVYGLTAELAPAYRQPQLGDMFFRRFLGEKERQLNAGDEKGPAFFVPFGGF